LPVRDYCATPAWFAGLVFDPQGRARFTVATYVRHGGRGGENAALISAQLARYLIEIKK
jgi:cell division protein FtsI/penicillin-binding protein 2